MDVVVVNDIKENSRDFEIKLEILHCFIHSRENLLLFIEATLIQYFLLSLVCIIAILIRTDLMCSPILY